MIPAEVTAEIIRRLHAAEAEHHVRILLAVESGSRAWGFESPDSDYDARFIYAHPRDWYVSIGLEEQRDVIEYPIADDIDLSGWDIRKALRLFRNSNPAFVEWIQSPIVYLEHGPFAATVRQLLPEVYSCASGVHHYRSMARNTYRSHLNAVSVPLKKYFYVLRPLLSVRWLERYGSPPPIEFGRLLHLVDGSPSLLADINALLDRKRAAPEMGLGPAVPTINAFIEHELGRLDGLKPASQEREDALGTLDRVFRSCLPNDAEGRKPATG